MLASPFLGAAIAYDMKGVALGGCLLAAVSDWLDGHIAKNYNQKSYLGSLLDPLADKLVIGSLTIGLTIEELIPYELSTVIVGRDVLLIAGSIWMRYCTLPPGVKFFDYSHSSMFSIAPSTASRINTGLQFSLLLSTLGCYTYDPTMISNLEPLWYVTGLSTVFSGAGYMGNSGLISKVSSEVTGKDKSVL
jgi:cardiolipin synthase